jgi:hypothetical protein
MNLSRFSGLFKIAIMKPLLIFTLALSLVGIGQAATLQVDWLEPGPGVDLISLADDGGAPAGVIGTVVNSGIGFPGHPAPRSFSALSWVSSPPFEDSLTLVADVDAVVMRVAPVAGAAAFVMEARLLPGESYVIMLGGFLTTPNGGTTGAMIQALNPGGTGAISLLAQAGYDDGTKAETGALSWDGSFLSPVGGAGESGYAFFAVDFANGGERSIRVTVPSANATGAGDDLVFAVGRVVPEPSSFILMLLGGMLCFRRRK